MKTILLKVLLALWLPAFIGLYGCRDHSVDPLVLKTLPFEFVTNTGFVFKFETSGTPHGSVVEHGIVYTAYFRTAEDHKIDPTIDDVRIVFPSSLQVGLNQFIFGNNFFQGRTFFYYRAYALFNDGTVEYGNRIAYTVQ